MKHFLKNAALTALAVIGLATATPNFANGQEVKWTKKDSTQIEGIVYRQGTQRNDSLDYQLREIAVEAAIDKATPAKVQRALFGMHTLNIAGPGVRQSQGFVSAAPEFSGISKYTTLIANQLPYGVIVVDPGQSALTMNEAIASPGNYDVQVSPTIHIPTGATLLNKPASPDSLVLQASADLIKRGITVKIPGNLEATVQAENQCPWGIREIFDATATLPCTDATAANVSYEGLRFFASAQATRNKGDFNAPEGLGDKQLQRVETAFESATATVGAHLGKYQGAVVSLTGHRSKTDELGRFLSDSLSLGRQFAHRTKALGARLKTGTIEATYLVQSTDRTLIVDWNRADVPGSKPEVVQNILPQIITAQTATITGKVLSSYRDILKVSGGLLHTNKRVYANAVAHYKYFEGDRKTGSGEIDIEAGITHTPFRAQTQLFGRYFGEPNGMVDRRAYVTVGGCIEEENQNACASTTAQWHKKFLLGESGNVHFRGVDLAYQRFFAIDKGHVHARANTSLYTGRYNGGSAPYVVPLAAQLGIGLHKGNTHVEVRYSHQAPQHFGKRQGADIFLDRELGASNFLSLHYAITKGNTTVGLELRNILPGNRANIGRYGEGEKVGVVGNITVSHDL